MIKEALDAYAKSKALEKTFLLDRTRTIGASEIGLCARSMYWRKTVNAPPEDEDFEDNWGARVRGTVMEDKFWVPAMKKRFGKNLLLAGDKQITVHDRYLSSTIDGLVINQPRDALAKFGIPDIGPSKCFTLECKTIDPRVNLTKTKEEHHLQTQTGLGLIRDLTKFKPIYSLISYIDASFWDEVDEFVTTFDQDIYDRMHERAKKIKTATSPRDLQPEGWIAGGKECEYCPHTKACGVIRRSVPVTEAAADPQFVAEMTDMCIEHEKIKAAMGELEIKLNTQKQAIKDRLREKSISRLPGVVTWSPVKGRNSTDNKALKEAAALAGIDVSQFETTGDPTDNLRVLTGIPANR